MKLADLVAANCNIILLLPRFGIRLGFGDRSVLDVCAEFRIPSDFFLLICNIYTYDDYFPDPDELALIDMSPLVPYLRASHRYYIEERIPHLERHLLHITEGVGERSATALRKYFEDYKHEVEEHFRLEERDLFPALDALRPGERLSKSALARYADSHGHIKDKLSDLTRILYKYIPGSNLTEELVELVFGFLQLSADLEKHTLIEDRLLLPDEDCQLSAREQEILAFVAKGMSSKAIADALNLSVHTVNSHRKNISRKTGIRSVAGLAVYATIYANGLDTSQ